MVRPSEAWRGDRWRPAVWNGILRRLEHQRGRIADRLGLEDETEIDAAFSDLAIALRRCWSISRDVNRAKSDPQVRKDLTQLLASDPPLLEKGWSLDPNARALIESCWPGSPHVLEDVQDGEADLREAIQNALAELPAPPRGRPSGTIDHAGRQFASELAEIYRRYKGKAPTRVVDTETQQEVGPFGEFVKAVMDTVPASLRRYRSAPADSVSKSADHLIRLAVEGFDRKRTGD